MRISGRNLALGCALLLLAAVLAPSDTTGPSIREAFAPWAEIGEGQKHVKGQRHTEAVAAFSRAIQRAPNIPDSYIYRGHACLSLQRPADAVRDYTSYLALRPATANALWGRAQAHNDLRQYRSAIDDATAALAVNSTLAGALYHRAYAWNRLGNTTAAQADVTAGLASGTADDCINGLLEQLQRKLQHGDCEALISGLAKPFNTAELLTGIR